MGVSYFHNLNKKFLILAAAITLCACQSMENQQTALEEANLKHAVYCMESLEIRKDLKAFEEECLGDTYTQHTPRLADGKAAMLAYFAKRFEENPDFTIEIKRAGADGDLVWIHLHALVEPNTLGYAVINIFRMENGRFVEHWNVGQPVAETSLNNNTMF